MITVVDPYSKGLSIRTPTEGLKEYLKAQKKTYEEWGIFAEPKGLEQFTIKPEEDKLTSETETDKEE